MPITGGLSRPSLTTATTPKIYNVTCTLANTEYSLVLSSDTKAFSIKARDRTTIKLAYSSGDSGSLYITVGAGSVYSEDNITFNGTIYFQTNKANQVLEILEWT